VRIYRHDKKMTVCIEKLKRGVFCIPVREWAQTKLEQPIKHIYTLKSNAIRAVRDPKRNTITLLSQLAWDNYQRAQRLEEILLKLRQILIHNHVGTGVSNARSINSGDSDLRTGDAGSGSEA
jgi:hypothetical protein